jgi:putative Mg2+ transporter-C (MgtC) family protein
VSWLGVLARLGAAALMGAAIGWERHLRGRPAGLRTHMLVGMGAAVVVMLPSAANVGDVGHAVQGVATGVGFICAGDIFRRARRGGGGEQVMGLTSAAALWLTAALGMAAARAEWALLVVGTALALTTLTIVRVLEHFAVRPRDMTPDEMTKDGTHDVKSR